MDKLRKTAMLLCIAGIPVAAAPFLTPSPDLCFASGSVTYRLSSTTQSSDYRVAIDNQTARPDLRIRLVDGVEAADFALTDDAGALIGSACQAGGLVKTVRTVQPGAGADLTIAVSRQAADADFSLYVHSARVSHFDAAALFALIRQAPDTSRELDGEQRAELR